MCGKSTQITNTKRINIYLYKNTMYTILCLYSGRKILTRPVLFSGMKIFF